MASVLKELHLSAPSPKPWTRRSRAKLPDYTQYYSASLIPHALAQFEMEMEMEMEMLGYEVSDAWITHAD